MSPWTNVFLDNCPFPWKSVSWTIFLGLKFPWITVPCNHAWNLVIRYHCRKQSSNFSFSRNRYYGSVSGSRKSHFWLEKLTHNNSFWIQKLTYNISFLLKNLWIQKLKKWISFWPQKLTQNVTFWSQKLTWNVSFCFWGQKLTLWASGTISGFLKYLLKKDWIQAGVFPLREEASWKMVSTEKKFTDVRKLRYLRNNLGVCIALNHNKVAGAKIFT